MSAGLALFNKIITDNERMAVLRENNISFDDLDDKEQKVYNFITTYVELYNKYPKKETIFQETGISFPMFPNEPLAYWINKIKRRKRTKEFLSVGKKIQDVTSDGDLETAEDIIRNSFRTLQKDSEDVFSLPEVSEQVLELHDKRQKAGTMSGVPFGIPYIDQVSDGAQPDDTVAICGRPSTGKTYLMLSCALHANLQKKKVLIMSCEMSPFQCARRIIAMKSRVPSTGIRLGRLSFWAREKVVENIREMSTLFNETPFYIMKTTLNTTVEDLAYRILDLEPDVVYIDGAYLLKARQKNLQRWERVTYTAEYIKNLATTYRIPLIGTYQFNRKGPGNLGTIAYSDSIGQLASIVLSLDEEDDMSASLRIDHKQYKVLELIKGREGEKGKVRLIYDMKRTNVEQEEVISGYVNSIGG